ncbi:MAG: type II toxin-antitoxin system VapC family toxin [Thermofilum sp.]|nr:type II toxin-antitoxin system VapC family toxin [Thermofilum sp.]
MRVVLEASALAKWFLVEEESREMRLLRDKIIGSEIEAHVPSLVFVELANLLRYTRGLTPVDVADSVVAAMSIGLILHDFVEVLGEAISMAFEKGLTVYDSIYVALAERLDAVLITYDKVLPREVKRSRKASQLLGTYS